MSSSSSSIIIRLQNLPWEAGAADIRAFFAGLQIPDGNVHIVGGNDGDAFIGFATDEDARRAMAKAGLPLKGAPIRLLLSSRLEMSSVIDAARNDRDDDQDDSAEDDTQATPDEYLDVKQSYSPPPDSKQHVFAHIQQQQQQQQPYSGGGGGFDPRASAEAQLNAWSQRSTAAPVVQQREPPAAAPIHSTGWQPPSSPSKQQQPSVDLGRGDQQQQGFPGLGSPLRQPQLPTPGVEPTASIASNVYRDRPDLLGSGAAAAAAAANGGGGGSLFSSGGIWATTGATADASPLSRHPNPVSSISSSVWSTPQQQQQQSHQQQQQPQESILSRNNMGGSSNSPWAVNEPLMGKPEQPPQQQQLATSNAPPPPTSNRLPLFANPPSAPMPVSSSSQPQQQQQQQQQHQQQQQQQQQLHQQQQQQVESNKPAVISQTFPPPPSTNFAQQQATQNDPFSRQPPFPPAASVPPVVSQQWTQSDSMMMSQPPPSTMGSSSTFELDMRGPPNPVPVVSQQQQQPALGGAVVKTEPFSRKKGLLAAPPMPSMDQPPPAMFPSGSGPDLGMMPPIAPGFGRPPPPGMPPAPFNQSGSLGAFPAPPPVAGGITSSALERARYVRLDFLPIQLLHYRSLKAFLKPCNLPGDDSIVLYRNPTTTKPLPVGIVKLQNDREFHLAMALTGKQGVRCTETTREEFEHAQSMCADPLAQKMGGHPATFYKHNDTSPMSARPTGPGGDGQQNKNRRNTAKLQLQNVPFRCTGIDIATWLKTLNVPEPTSITMVPKEEGRWSDTWSLEYERRKDADQLWYLGHSKDRNTLMIQERKIRVLRGDGEPEGPKMEGFGHGERVERRRKSPSRFRRSHSRERDRRRRSRSRSPLRRSKDADDRGDRDSRRNRRGRGKDVDHRSSGASSVKREVMDTSDGGSSGVDTCVELTNVPSSVGQRDVISVFGELNVRSVHLVPDGRVFVELLSADTAQRAAGKAHVMFFGTERAAVRSVSKQTMQREIDPSNHPGVKSEVLRGVGDGATQPFAARPPVDSGFLRSIGPAGLVLRCTCLPADITLDEMAMLFEPVGGLVEDSVRMHFDPAGQATGECLLAVPTTDVANNAVSQLNGKLLRGGKKISVAPAE